MADLQTPEEYLATLPEVAQDWLREFNAYVEHSYPTLTLTMFRSRPMFKFGRSYLDGYIMFTAAKTHFTAHAIDFDLVAGMRERLPRAKFGKGSVKVPFAQVEAKPALRDFVDAVMARHGIPKG